MAWEELPEEAGEEQQEGEAGEEEERAVGLIRNTLVFFQSLFNKVNNTGLASFIHDGG